MQQPPKSTAIERLKRALDAIPELKQLSYDSPDFHRWQRNTRVAISRTFGDASNQIVEFDNIFHSSVIIEYIQEDYVRELELATALLKSMIEEVEEYWPDDNQAQISSSAEVYDRPKTNKVFVIHGRDDGTKQTVARFLERLSLKPVILHEQPNEGRTIIEKFQDHADVGFAVALLTPDDVGSLKDEGTNLNPRARQNVIFEFGYFIGKLDRKRVCALVKGNVEKPSDYDGVLYIPLDDSDGWKMRLIRELKTAGFEVDANKAISA